MRKSRPAPTISTTARADSEAISRPRRRLVLPLVPEPLAPSRMATAISAFEDCRAGTNPNPSPARRETNKAKASTVQSTCTSASRGIRAGRNCTKCKAAIAVRTPTMPDTRDSIIDSVSNCRIIRARLAPMASRTAISRCLPEARARSRFATLTEASRMISTTAPVSTNNMGRTLPTNDSCNGSPSIDQPDPAG